MASMNFWMITEMIGAFRHLFLICILENGPMNQSFRKVGWLFTAGLSMMSLAGNEARACHCGKTPCANPQPAMVSQQVTSYQTVTQTVYEQVPRTVTKTRYRTEMTQEQVPVTRTVYDSVMVTKMVKQPYTVCEQVATTIYKPVCETQMVNKVVTRYVPQQVTEQVPVTRYQKVTETQGSYVTRQVPVVQNVVQCGHHGLCGCGKAKVKAVVTGYECEQVYDEKPVCKTVASTEYKTVCRTKMVPVQETVSCQQLVRKMVPQQVMRNVTKVAYREVPVQVCEKRARQVQETVTRCVARQVPEQVQVTVMECVAKQVQNQVPVTTSVMVPVSAPAASAQASAQQ